MQEEQPMSQVKIRMEVQGILEKNIRHAIGSFQSKELNESGFLRDLFKRFELKPKANENK